MRGKSVAVAVALLLMASLASSASAFTCTGASCVATVSYTEPTTYVSGAPLTNLQDGVVTFQLDGGATQTLTIPASRPQGGGAISVPLAPQAIAVCTIRTLTSSLVVRTTAGGISSPVSSAPLVIDRTKLSTGQPDPQCTTPAPPTGVTVQ